MKIQKFFSPLGLTPPPPPRVTEQRAGTPLSQCRLITPYGFTPIWALSFFEMLEFARRLESHSKSSNTDISAHVATFDELGIDVSRIESSDTDESYLIS